MPTPPPTPPTPTPTPVCDAAAAAAAATATPTPPRAPHTLAVTMLTAWLDAISTTWSMLAMLEHMVDWLNSTTRMRSALQCRWYCPRRTRCAQYIRIAAANAVK